MRSMRWLLALLVLGAAWTSGERLASAQWGWGSCTITTNPVNFGTYDVFSSTDLPSTGTVRYQCTGLRWSYVTVYLSKGSAPNNNPRQMAKGADRQDRQGPDLPDRSFAVDPHEDDLGKAAHADAAGAEPQRAASPER